MCYSLDYNTSIEQVKKQKGSILMQYFSDLLVSRTLYTLIFEDFHKFFFMHGISLSTYWELKVFVHCFI